MKAEFPFQRGCPFGAQTVFGRKVTVSTVGINEEIIKRYIENQGQADEGQNNVSLF